MDVTNFLAAAVQACHDMVPPDVVEPLLKLIVNRFVHDRSRTESIVVGLNVVREMCLRIPLLMTGDLLQDLVLYKKSHEKAVSSAARSLISLFREANIRKKMTKEERKALIKAGREDTGKYQARSAIKQKKTGGLSNQQKEHKKAMPLAAKRSKIKRSKSLKKMKQMGVDKQFRGRKAWK